MANSWIPIKRSPVHYKLEKMGAVLENISQWQCVERFSDPNQEIKMVKSGVGLLDLSFAGKWELKGKDLEEFLKSNLDQPSPNPGTAILTGSDCLIRITQNHALLITQQEDNSSLLKLITTKFKSSCFQPIDRSNGLGQFLLCGPQARTVLSKLTSLDLREDYFANLCCACVPMAAIPTTIVHRNLNTLPSYQIVFNSESGEYLWDCIMEAGAEFDIGPFGLTALRLLER